MLFRSVRATEEAAKAKSGKAKIRTGSKQQAIQVLAQKVGDSLNTTVRIKLGLRKGVIEIDFASVDDLKRILEEMGQETDF